MADTGTPKTISTWLRNTATGPESSFELYRRLDSLELVTSWTWDEVKVDKEKWASQVSELATEDARGLGETTRYELRHLSGERQRGTCPLRREVKRDIEDDGLNGSMQSLLAQSQRHAQKAVDQTIAMAAEVTKGQASMVKLVEQTAEMMRAVQATNIEMHAEALESRTKETKQLELVDKLLDKLPQLAMMNNMRKAAAAANGAPKTIVTPPPTPKA